MSSGSEQSAITLTTTLFPPSVISATSKPFPLFPPAKQACISLGSGTRQRVSTGTAPRGSSGNTWLPEASPPSCILTAGLPEALRLTVFSQGSGFAFNSAGRYYHSRTPRHTAPAEASTSAAAAAAAAGTPGPPSDPRGPAQLPSFMRGVHVFFYNLPASERKSLARYLLTYPFLAGRQGALCCSHISSTLIQA